MPATERAGGRPDIIIWRPAGEDSGTSGPNIDRHRPHRYGAAAGRQRPAPIRRYWGV